ncbi:MAG: hypothetical protein AAFX51_01770 [Cyanobacteria bacterium J06636_28]
MGGSKGLQNFEIKRVKASGLGQFFDGFVKAVKTEIVFAPREVVLGLLVNGGNIIRTEPNLGG